MKTQKSYGTLYLVISPISEKGELTISLREKLLKAFEENHVIAVEDLKPARQRWRAWDLPREAIESFVAYNEHSRGEGAEEDLLSRLKKKQDVYLMSDGGTPGFCDPGRSLIDRCHQEGIKVSVTESGNSLIPTVAMSGFTEGAFEFLGFPPREKEQRRKWYEDLIKNPRCAVFMDTPYRLDRVVSELLEVAQGSFQKRRLFILCDINRESENYYWGELNQFASLSPFEKAEFVAVLAPIS